MNERIRQATILDAVLEEKMHGHCIMVCYSSRTDTNGHFAS